MTETKDRALITGIAGFAGSHLAEFLLAEGTHVEGTCLQNEPLTNIEHLSKRISLHRCDVRSLPCLLEATAKSRPSVVYHLAAVSSVTHADQNPKEVLAINFGGTLRLVQAMQQAAPKAKLVYVSSSEIYGKVLPRENPITEHQAPAPVHFYGFTKLLAEQLLGYYHKSNHIPVVLLRPFNHMGPRQSGQFVCSSLAQQVARIEKGEQEPAIQVGNLEPIRDFTDVRDIARAYRMAAAGCRPGIPYNVASGIGVSIQQILDQLLRFSNKQIRVVSTPSRARKVEIPVVRGDATRFIDATGWYRSFDLESTLQDTYRYWLER